MDLLFSVMTLLAQAGEDTAAAAGRAIALGVGGGLAVILGLEALGVLTLPFGIVLFLFEVGLVATLQAFIFATLTAIYLGGAVAEHH